MAAPSNKRPINSSKKPPQKDEKRGKLWSDEELGTFLDIWASQEIQNKLDGTVRNSTVFQVIVRKMGESGFDRTTKEIKNKIKNLKRDYKKTIDHNNRSGVNLKTMQHMDKLDNILGGRPSAEPLVVFQSGRSFEAEMDDQWEDDDEEDEATADESVEDGDDSNNLIELEEADRDDPEDISESILSSLSSPNSSSESLASEENQRPSSSKNVSRKRQNSASAADNAADSKRPRKASKKTRMKETINLVADAFQEQMSRAEHSFREEMRKQEQEDWEWEKQWRQQMADEQRSFNDTMKGYLNMMTTMMTRQPVTQPLQPMQVHQYHMNHAHNQPSAPSRQGVFRPQSYSNVHQTRPTTSSQYTEQSVTVREGEREFISL